MKENRIIAEFVPQAWVNDYAVNVDPQGETTWDVTEKVLAMGREQALALRDDQYETDEFREMDTAPEWVQEWSGPFYVRVSDAIHDYFDDLDREEEGEAD